MIKKIFGTFGTRLLNACCGLMTLWLGTNFLGKEAWGIGGIVLVDVSLILIAIELLAGSGLIYYTPRKSFTTLMKISYCWSLIVVLFFALLFYLLSFSSKIYHSFVPQNYGFIILIMTFVYSLHNFNLNVLLGKERVGTQNILFIIQFMTQLCSMIIYIFIFRIRNVNAFIFSLLTGYVVAFICGFFCIIPYIKNTQHEPIKDTLKDMFNFGSMIQLSTFVTMINRRLSYFVIKRYFGIADVGVYNSGTQISESTKLIGHSIALVQFSSISNMNDNKKAAETTLGFLKVAVIFTTLCMLIICLIPRSVYSWIFTAEFVGIKNALITMAPGMVFLAANMIFSHYFSGTNLPKHNLYASLIGLVIMIPSIFILVPLYGFVGAGISVSLTNFATIIYQWIVFKKISRTKAKELIPTRDDFKNLINGIKNQLFENRV